MGAKEARPYLRLVVVAVFAVVMMALAAVLVGIPVAGRQRAIELAQAYTARGEPQEAPLDAYQVPPYVLAVAVCGVMAVRLRRRGDRLPVWVFLGATAAWLLWRELPYDEQMLGANSFSWAKYLTRGDVPLGHRLVWGAASIGFTVGLLAYAVLKWRAVLALVREKLLTWSSSLVALAGLSLLTAQGLDKHRSVDRLLGTAISTWELKDYCEESLELVGAVLLAMACLMAVLEEPAGEPAGRAVRT